MHTSNILIILKGLKMIFYHCYAHKDNNNTIIIEFIEE